MLHVLIMKNGIIFTAVVAILTACSNSGSKDPGLSDSLGNKYTDTSGRSDTAYYERMLQKTNAGDTTSNTNTPRKNDTAYYERLPNKSNPPDSSR